MCRLGLQNRPNRVAVRPVLRSERACFARLFGLIAQSPVAEAVASDGGFCE